MNIDRFKGADFMNITKPKVLLIGLGGIGHGVARHLVNTLTPLTVFDFDVVEHHNCIPQGYDSQFVGLNKVDAFLKMLQSRGLYSYNNNIETVKERYTEDSITEEVVIVAVDNFKARRDAFKNWKSLPNRKLFIDGRLLAEYFQVFCITPATEEWYERTYLDGRADENDGVMCTYQSTSFCSALIHGSIVQKLMNYLTGKPFHTFHEYNGLFDTHSYTSHGEH